MKGAVELPESARLLAKNTEMLLYPFHFEHLQSTRYDHFNKLRCNASKQFQISGQGGPQKSILYDTRSDSVSGWLWGFSWREV